MSNANECVECETYHEDGEGLTKGRCKECRAAYLARNRPAKRKPRKSKKTEE